MSLGAGMNDVLKNIVADLEGKINISDMFSREDNDANFGMGNNVLIPTAHAKEIVAILKTKVDT